MSPAFDLQLALIALIVEGLLGYSDTLYRFIGHPVTWLGAILSRLEGWLNRGDDRRQKGVTALVILLSVAFAVSMIIQFGLPEDFFGLIVAALVGSVLLAQRSLYVHVRAVAEGLAIDLQSGRAAVSQIVGRDPEQLDEAGVVRAAIESLSENFSDGIVAPAFWMAVLGLPGAALYKAANTADSMIGHLNPRYREFGWAAARFDDWINLPASRLAALWLMIAAAFTRGASMVNAGKAVWRDARLHRSPNAGWPEAAMAGALGLKLGGPRSYDKVMVKDAYMGNGRREATLDDLNLALIVYRRACSVQIFVVGLVVLMWPV